MPRLFSIDHTSVIKAVAIGTQNKYNIANVSYYFDKNSSLLYPANFIGALLHNISKSLLVMLESTFTYQNEYRFMLNSNLDLLAHSKNFEDEYYLNKSIFEKFNLRFFDLLKIKPEKLNEIYKKQFNIIKYQKTIRHAKTEDYFIPELYVPPGYKNNGTTNPKNFNTLKNNFLSTLINSNENNENRNDNINNNNQYNDDDEEKKLIQIDKIKNSFNEIFIQHGEVLFHRIIQYNTNKGRFIENLERELIKVSESDFKYENDIKNYNLAASAKKLIYNLLTKNDIENEFLTVTIKYSFYYDKPYYFIAVDDPKKSYLKFSRTIHFQNEQKFEFYRKSTILKSLIPYNKRSRNNLTIKKSSLNVKIESNKNIPIKKDETVAKSKSFLIKNKFIDNFINEKNKILDKINTYRMKINKDKFILIIRIISSIIVFLILLIYIIIIILEISSINVYEKILIAFYYNFYTRDLMLGVISVLLYNYYHSYILEQKEELNEIDNHYLLTNLTHMLNDKYHNFTESFFDYNLAINSDFNLIYKKRNFMKLRGYWQVVEYESKFSSEMDYVIFNIFQLDKTFNNNDKIDFENFLFFKGAKKSKERVKSTFIKLLYSLSANAEFTSKYILMILRSQYIIHIKYILIMFIFILF